MLLATSTKSSIPSEISGPYKSTFLKILSGEQEQSEGQIIKDKN